MMLAVVQKFEETLLGAFLEEGCGDSSLGCGVFLQTSAEWYTWEVDEADRQGQGQEGMESTLGPHGEEILGQVVHASYWEACTSYMGVGVGVACAENAWEVLGLIHALKVLISIPTLQGLVHGQTRGSVAEPLRIARRRPFLAQEESWLRIRTCRIGVTSCLLPCSLIFSITPLNNLMLPWEDFLFEDLCAAAFVYTRYFEDLGCIHIGIGTATHDRYASYHAFVNLNQKG
jgi:hypothetical protein